MDKSSSHISPASFAASFNCLWDMPFPLMPAWPGVQARQLNLYTSLCSFLNWSISVESIIRTEQNIPTKINSSNRWPAIVEYFDHVKAVNCALKLYNSPFLLYWPLSLPFYFFIDGVLGHLLFYYFLVSLCEVHFLSWSTLSINLFGYGYLIYPFNCFQV